MSGSRWHSYWACECHNCEHVWRKMKWDIKGQILYPLKCPECGSTSFDIQEDIDELEAQFAREVNYQNIIDELIRLLDCAKTNHRQLPHLFILLQDKINEMIARDHNPGWGCYEEDVIGAIEEYRQQMRKSNV